MKSNPELLMKAESEQDVCIIFVPEGVAAAETLRKELERFGWHVFTKDLRTDSEDAFRLALQSATLIVEIVPKGAKANRLVRYHVEDRDKDSIEQKFNLKLVLTALEGAPEVPHPRELILHGTSEDTYFFAQVAHQILKERRMPRTEELRKPAKVKFCALEPLSPNYVRIHAGLEEKFIIRFLRQRKHEHGTIAVLRGMGGAGKTWLARQVAHVLSENFRDGVLWINAGEGVDTRQLLVNLLRDIGGEPTSRDVNTLKMEALELLERRSFLIVLDNVWTEEQMQDLMVLKPTNRESCMIVTLRDEHVAEKFQASHNYTSSRVPGRISEEESIKIMEKASISHGVPFDRSVMARVAEKVAYHPLSLQVVSGSLTQFESWAEMLENMKGVLRQALDSSFREIVLDTLNLLSPEVREAFCCLGILAADARISSMDVSWLTGTEFEDAKRLSTQLVRSSLLVETEEEHFSIHDMCLDVARELLQADEGFDMVKKRYLDKMALLDAASWTAYAMAHAASQLESSGDAILRLKILEACVFYIGKQGLEFVEYLLRNNCTILARQIVQQMTDEEQQAAIIDFMPLLRKQKQVALVRAWLDLICQIVDDKASSWPLWDVVHDTARHLLENVGSSLLPYLPKSLRDDQELVLLSVKGAGTMLQFASERMRGDRDVVIVAVRRTWRAFEFACAHLRSDPNVFEEALQSGGPSWQILAFAGSNIRANEELVLDAVQKNTSALQYAAEELLSSEDFLRRAVKIDGLALEFALVKSCALEELAVESNGLALKLASGEACRNAGIVRIAVENNWKAFEFADASLQQDRDFVMELVGLDGRALAFASGSLKEDGEIVLKAVQQNGIALSFAGESFRDDIDIALVALNSDALAYRFLSDRLKINPDVIRASHSNSVFSAKDLLEHGCEEIRSDKYIVLNAIDANGMSLEYASPALKDDKECALTAVSNDGLALEFVSYNLRGDFEVIEAALMNDWKAAAFVSEETKKDPEAVFFMTTFAPETFKFAAKEIKENIEIVKVLAAREWHILEFVPQHIRGSKEVILAVLDSDESDEAMDRWKVLKWAARSVRNDKTVIMKALTDEREPDRCMALEYASLNLQNDREVVLTAIQQGHGSWRALQFASLELKSNVRVVSAAIEVHWRALEFASFQMKASKDMVEKALRSKEFMSWKALAFAAPALKRNREFVQDMLQCIRSKADKQKMLQISGITY